MVEAYRAEAKKTDKKITTIQGEARNFASFLAHMQSKGASEISEVTQTMVVSHFTDENGNPNKSYSLKKQIVTVFKTCAPLFSNGECECILSYIPKLKKRRRNIQYLTGVETAKIKSVLLSPDSCLSFRNRAIGLLSFEMGLRCCDIAGLTLSAIDWKRELIQIIQQKTDCPLELPLLTYSGNAVYDYLKKERPKSTTTEIFLQARPPHKRLEARSLVNIASKIMKEAGVRQNPGDKQGFHLFRHHLATALLEHDVSGAVISKALGHSSPKSVEPYLNTDFVHLKENALGIEMFPVDLEVVLK
jgi:integrase